ncbi:unnamed protein product [Phytomonas sp. Hart1]|nr:unnamed protein product [Phytomonas sp. Hart1]|eukprot:CCW71603.1 unnamed protein product [Phytomonas sp. isolate Hart1]
MASVSDLNLLAEQLYTSPDPGLRQSAYEQLNSFTLEGSEPGAFYTILHQSNSQYSLLFAAQGLVTWFKHNLKYISSEVRRRLLRGEVGECLLRLAEGGAPQHVLTSMLVTYAKLTKLAFLKEPYLLEAVEFPIEMLQASNGLRENVPGNNEDADHKPRVLGLMLLDALVVEFSNFDSAKSKTFMNFSEHRRCSNNFRDECLRTLFEAALRDLEKIDASFLHEVECSNGKSSTLFLAENTVALVKNCMCFDFMAIIIDETEEVLSAQVPSSWRDLVLAESTQELLWRQHAALPYPLCATLFNGLSALCGIRRTFFDETPQRVRFLDLVLEQMAAIGQLPDGRLRIPHFANLYGEACLRLIMPFGYRDLHSSAWFSQWLEVVRQVSVDVFRVPFGAEGSFTTASTFLSFWARLTTSQRMYLSVEEETTRKEVEPIAPALALTFFQTHVHALGEGEGDCSGEPALDSTVDPDDELETVLNQAESFATFALFEITETMERLVEYTTQHLGPRVLESPVAMGWLFFLAGCLARQVLANLDGSTAIPACMRFFMYCVDCVNYRPSIASEARGENSPACLFENFVERGMLHFITSFSAVFSSQHVHYELRSVIEGVFQSRERFVQFILNNSGCNILRDGSSDEGTVDIMRKSIDLIGEVIRDLPRSMLDTISLDLPPVVDLPLAQSMQTYKLRTNLYAVLCQLTLKKSSEHENFQVFFSSITDCIQNTLSGSPVGMDPLFIAGWMRNLRGVVFALGSGAESEVIVDFAQWFCEEAGSFGEILTGPSGESSIVVKSFLRLMIEVVSNRGILSALPRGCAHSALGLCLFKHLCQFIQIIVERAITDERVQAVTSSHTVYPSDKTYDLMLKPLALSMLCLRRCLGGGFVPLGAMWYYQDDTYDTTLLGLLRMLIVFPPCLFKDYAKAAHAVVELLGALTEGEGYAPLGRLATEELHAIFDLTLSLCEEVHTPTGTLLHGIGFLGFMSGFVREVKALSQPLGPAEGGGGGGTSGYNSHSNTPPPTPIPPPVYYGGGPQGQGGQNTLSILRTARAAREAMARLIAPMGDIWQRLLAAAMGIIVCQDRALSGCCSVIYPILETHPPFWYEFVENFVEGYPTHKHQAIREAVSLLTNASESYVKFFSEVVTFRQRMRAL